MVDFGAGTGTIAVELARRRPMGLEVIALDEQPQMLDILKAKRVARELRNLKAVLNDETWSLRPARKEYLPSMCCTSWGMKHCRI